MATRESMAVRTALASERARRASEALAAEFGVELPLPPRVIGGNPHMTRVLEMEHNANVLESLVRSFGTVAETSSGVDPTVLDGNAGAVKQYLDSIEDEGALNLLLAAETGGKQRKGVLKAIEMRQAELAAAAEEAEADEESEE
jgi:hypothetical protein